MFLDAKYWVGLVLTTTLIEFSVSDDIEFVLKLLVIINNYKFVIKL